MEKKVKKEYNITIWLNEEELDKLNQFVEEWHMNRSAMCRTAIMKYIEEWRKIR